MERRLSGSPRPQTLDERYGRRPAGRERWRVAATALVLTVMALAWGLWIARDVAGTPLYWQDVGFAVRGDSATDVTFDLSFDTDLDDDAVAVCTVRALNQMSAEVGLLDVRVERSGDRPVRSTVTVPTSERAVTGLVKECVLR